MVTPCQSDDEAWTLAKKLIQLLLKHKSQRKLAEETKRSITWVEKWRKRPDEADPDDQEILKSRSRRPKEAGSPKLPATQPGQKLWQPAAPPGFSRPAGLAAGAGDG